MSPSLSPAAFSFLAELLRSRSGLVIGQDKIYLLETRLAAILRRENLRDLNALADRLRGRGADAVAREVVEAMTTNESFFFRDDKPFQHFRTQALPRLIAARPAGTPLRVWSAAASSGQEAYSLAMTLCEHFPQLQEWKVEITGTDISAQVVERARAGRYQRIEVNRGLPARYLLKYMERTGDEWEIVPELKLLCRFRRRNLCNPLLLTEKYDGILLRNVLLYFSMDTRRKLLLNMHRLLEPDGFLILGSSEQTDLPSHFQPVLAHNACYYKPVAQNSR